MSPSPALPLDVGVIGVGSMGKHHARVYDAIPHANLVGVYDTDEVQAATIARKHDAAAMDLEPLLASIDAVSVAVPTTYHYDMVCSCLDANVATLVEKPIAESLTMGRKLRAKARKADVPVQVGHVERFNPAIRTLEEFIAELSIISISAERLGPPPEREIADSAVLDLMIHDIDIVLSLLDDRPTSVQSAGVRGNRYASALLEFPSDLMASLTASRLTQRKVRRLVITAETCLIELDYIDQTIEIHRHSLPEYVESDGDVRFRHESIVERPRVPNEEPLRNELESFLDAVATGATPEVTVDDGLAALEIAQRIDQTGSYRTAQPGVARE